MAKTEQEIIYTVIEATQANTFAKTHQTVHLNECIASCVNCTSVKLIGVFTMHVLTNWSVHCQLLSACSRKELINCFLTVHLFSPLYP